MKKYIKAFTLVELIVGITISMLLMFSVSMFVSNGIKNITNQKSSLENDIKTKDFTKSLYDSLNSIDKTFAYKIWSNNELLLKVNKLYDKGGFLYIGSGNLDKYYCDSGSESDITNHFINKNFIPFEGMGGDIFDGKSYDNGTISTNMFSGTINSNKNLVGPTDLIDNGGVGFVSDTLGHSIYKFNYPALTNFTKIVGKEVFGDEFSDGSIGTGVFLNNPTGLSYATIGSTGYLFISDTLNDRVLYLNLNTNKIYKLLGREEGLKEPTGIYYDDTEKTLYIANSGKKQILAYSSSGSFVSSVNFNFTPKKDIKDINKLVFSFHYSSGYLNPDITGPSLTGSFSFTNILAGEDLLTTGTHDLNYHFVDFTNPPVSEVLCLFGPFPKYILSGTTPIKCTLSNTGIIGNYRYQTFTGGENYNIKINDISGPDFGNIGAYYIGLDMYSGSTLKKTYYFPYFSKTDSDIFTKSDNILKVLTGGLGYPTGIYASGSNIIFNDFLQRKKIEITKTGSLALITNLSNFDFSKLQTNTLIDNTLYNPIDNYEISVVDNVLNIYLNYYKNFSCYNLDENKGKSKEFIIKKNLK